MSSLSLSLVVVLCVCHCAHAAEETGLTVNYLTHHYPSLIAIHPHKTNVVCFRLPQAAVTHNSSCFVMRVESDRDDDDSLRSELWTSAPFGINDRASSLCDITKREERGRRRREGERGRVERRGERVCAEIQEGELPHNRRLTLAAYVWVCTLMNRAFSSFGSMKSSLFLFSK